MYPRRDKLRARLEAARQDLLLALADLDQTQAGLSTTNPGWVVRDLVAHLAAAERGHQQVIEALMAGEVAPDPAFELDVFNEQEVAARRGRSLAELLDELDTARRATLALLDAVGTENWDLAGWHPGGFDTTVEGCFRVIAIHEKRHLKEIRAALAAGRSDRESPA